MLSRSGLLVILLSCACVIPSHAQTLVTDITVPGTPNGIAVNPNNNRIYVDLSTSTGPAVGVIDGSTNTVIDTIPTPQGASFVAVNIATGRVYSAGCNFSAPPSCTVTVIDGTTDAIITTIPVNGSNGIGVQGIAVNPVTNLIYVSDDMNYDLEVIDGETNTTAYVNTHNTEMLGLAVDFGTNQLLGAPSGGVLDIFNGPNFAFQQVKVGVINQGVAVNSFTSIAYVTNNQGDTLGVVNLKTLKATNLTVGTAPYGVCVDYLSNLVFVAVEGNSAVIAIDGRTNAKIGSVNAASSYLDVNPATRMVYATSIVPGQNAVHVISE